VGRVNGGDSEGSPKNEETGEGFCTRDSFFNLNNFITDFDTIIIFSVIFTLYKKKIENRNTVM
jgi:hypothetical protein